MMVYAEVQFGLYMFQFHSFIIEVREAPSKFTEFITSVGEAYNSTFASLSNLPSLY